MISQTSLKNTTSNTFSWRYAGGCDEYSAEKIYGNEFIYSLCDIGIIRPLGALDYHWALRQSFAISRRSSLSYQRL